MSEKYPEKQWFASKLREALEAMGATQADLQKLLEEAGHPIEQQRLSHLMQGRNYPNPEDLKELVKALGVSADWTLSLTSQSLPAADLDEMVLRSKGEGRIDRAMRDLAKEEQDQVLAFAEFLRFRRRGGLPPSSTIETKPIKPSDDNGSGVRAESDQRAISAVLAVMRRHMNQDEINDVIDELLDVAPSLRDLILRMRTPPKDSGLQGR